MAIETSKAKYLRDLLDKSLELKIPAMAEEEFNRIFGITASADEIKEFTFAEVMIRQLVLKACAGNDKSIQEILDRLLGKPMQTSEVTSKSYNYHDFLIELRDGEIDLPAPKPANPGGQPGKRNVKPIAVLPLAISSPLGAGGDPPENDILADLL